MESTRQNVKAHLHLRFSCLISHSSAILKYGQT